MVQIKEAIFMLWIIFCIFVEIDHRSMSGSIFEVSCQRAHSLAASIQKICLHAMSLLY